MVILQKNNDEPAIAQFKILPAATANQHCKLSNAGFPDSKPTAIWRENTFIS
jgi:hypothetical protein